MQPIKGGGGQGGSTRLQQEKAGAALEHISYLYQHQYSSTVILVDFNRIRDEQACLYICHRHHMRCRCQNRPQNKDVLNLLYTVQNKLASDNSNSIQEHCEGCVQRCSRPS